MAIVTGAGRGIGKAIASHYAREGAKVLIAERDESLGNNLAQELTNTGAEAQFVQIDISQLADIADLTARTKQHFGGIDILANNAAVTKSLGFLMSVKLTGSGYTVSAQRACFFTCRVLPQ
ncbi:hypothetical protein A9Q89_06930 [Gammaproteobacteria bacterium 53_120_T64]|nr:hypothetical protein A9Q89_06930 [Gammaproteobacteria bacterium 53_120_T64]